MQAGERFFKEVQMSLFLLLLYIFMYIIMALIVWFDKREGKGRHGKAETQGMDSQYTDGGGMMDTNAGE